MQKARPRSPIRSNNRLDKVLRKQHLSSVMLLLLRGYVFWFILIFLVSHGAWNYCLNNFNDATHLYGSLLGPRHSLWLGNFVRETISWPGPVQAPYLMVVSSPYTWYNPDPQIPQFQYLAWSHPGYLAYVTTIVCLESWMARDCTKTHLSPKCQDRPGKF